MSVRLWCHHIAQDPFSSPKLIGIDWGHSTYNGSGLSHMMEINWLHDGNRLVCLGPMIGIDRVQFHQPDWDGLCPESV